MTKNSELNRVNEILLNTIKVIKLTHGVLENVIESNTDDEALFPKQIELAKKQKNEEIMREGIVIRLIDEMIAQNVVNNIKFCDIVLDLIGVPRDTGYKFDEDDPRSFDREPYWKAFEGSEDAVEVYERIEKLLSEVRL